MSEFEFEVSSDEVIWNSNFRWKIAHFFTLLQQQDFLADSPSFSAAGATWFLQVYRNKKKILSKISVGCIDINIVRIDSIFSRHSVSFSFTIDELRDGENQYYAGKKYFEAHEDVLELSSSFTKNLEMKSPVLDSSLTLFGTLCIKGNRLMNNTPPETDNFEKGGGKEIILFIL